jgi:hypothetical protein
LQADQLVHDVVRDRKGRRGYYYSYNDLQVSLREAAMHAGPNAGVERRPKAVRSNDKLGAALSPPLRGSGLQEHEQPSEPWQRWGCRFLRAPCTDSLG